VGSVTNLDLAWLYAKLAVDLQPRVDEGQAERMAQHRMTAIDHIARASDPGFNINETREGIAQMLKLAGVIN
jgi:hypothetical protein